MGLMNTFWGNDVVEGFKGVQDGSHVDPSVGSVLGGLAGSAYKNIIKPPIQAMDYLGREINRSMAPQNEWEQAQRFNPQRITESMTEVGLLPTVGGLMRRPDLGTLSSMGVKDIGKSLSDRGIKSSISERPSEIVINKIIVPDGSRGGGAGTQAMQEILQYADKLGKKVSLSPSTDFGGSSVSRLKKFYKKLGFVENKGKSKDYEISESMYRPVGGGE